MSTPRAQVHQSPLPTPVGRPVSVSSIMEIEDACALAFVLLRSVKEIENVQNTNIGSVHFFSGSEFSNTVSAYGGEYMSHNEGTVLCISKMELSGFPLCFLLQCAKIRLHWTNHRGRLQLCLEWVVVQCYIQNCTITWCRQLFRCLEKSAAQDSIFQWIVFQMLWCYNKCVLEWTEALKYPRIRNSTTITIRPTVQYFSIINPQHSRKYH